MIRSSKGVLTISARVIATCFALVGFAAASVVGLFAANAPLTVLWRALVAMLVCWCAGRVIGALAMRTVQEHVDAYKRSHPIVADEGAVAPSPSTDSQENPSHEAAVAPTRG